MNKKKDKLHFKTSGQQLESSHYCLTPISTSICLMFIATLWTAWSTTLNKCKFPWKKQSFKFFRKYIFIKNITFASQCIKRNDKTFGKLVDWFRLETRADINVLCLSEKVITVSMCKSFTSIFPVLFDIKAMFFLILQKLRHILFIKTKMYKYIEKSLVFLCYL